MLATALPADVLARGEGPSLETLKGLITKKEGKIIGEVTEKRDRNTKHFIKDDYTYEADVYPYAVHYIKDGKWEDIDNNLVEAIDDENAPILQNKVNDFAVKFAKKSDSKKLVRIQKDKYEISWGMDNATAIDITVNQDNTDSSLTGNEKQRSLKNIISSVEYLEIQDNVDLQYKLLGDIVKENIIIKDKVDNTKFVFNLNVKNLTPKLQEDNSIIFYDNCETDNVIFKMEAPYMYDASHEESNKVAINLNEEGNGYKLCLTPDNEWLSSSERKFPITIDPPVSTSLVRQDIHDAHVCSNYSGTNYENSYILKTGYGSSSGVNRTYIAFTLPTLSSADLVTDAVIGLYNVSSGSTKQVNVHKVNGAWSSSSITYSNAPSYDGKIIDYQLISSSGYYYWHITPIVKAWYATGNNTGLMIKNQDEGTGYTEYYASDTSSAYTNLRAQVTINYVNNSGLESYWTYHSASAGRAGTGYVNDYNGNLIFTHDDLSMNGNRMPVNINHVYNSNDKDKSLYYGYGWRLNLSQRVEINDGFSDGRRYVYTDEDGTKHYFKADSAGVYKDESGIDLTLTIKSDNGYLIKDKSGNTLEFVSGGYLYKIIDKNGNTATLSYDGIILKKITDGAGRIIEFETNTSGSLTGIFDPSRRKISFGYTGNQLTSITYPDGKQTVYTYDSSNKLTSAANYDGYKISYEYYTASPYRVSKVKESGLSGTTTVAGNELGLSYGYNQTTFTDVSGKKETYIFNDSGNTTCVKDNDGNAQYSKYLDSNVNKLQISSKLQGTVTNYLRNHNLEISQNNWNSDYWTGSTGTSAFTTEDEYIGNQSMKVTKTNTSSRQFFNQTLSLTKGKTYTFSAYVKTNGISNTSGQGAALFINYQDSTGYYPTIESRFISGTNTWQRVEVKFTLPADSVSNTVYARAGIIGETGSAYFDCLQLEDGNIANRYNLVENPSLSYGSPTPEFWSRNSEVDSTDAVASIDGRTAFKINGKATSDKALYQVVNVSGNAGDTFVLSGWAKGDSVPIPPGSGRYFEVCFGVRKLDDTYQWGGVSFNEDSSAWQYASDVFVANGPYKSIEIYLIYYNNANTAYFDDIQLYKEEFGTSYQYDSKGNVVSTVDLAKQKTTFEYNTNNDLIKATSPKEGLYSYEYSTDGKRNLTKATSAENVVYSFTYDSYGNPETSRVGDSTTFINSSATYTADKNYIDTVTDSEGNIVNYDYNTIKGTLDAVSDANQKKTSYTYDNLERLETVSKTADSVIITNSYAYLNDRLNSITHNGFSYSFGYDSLGNNTTVAVGSQNLITNDYESRTSKLLKSTYANGQYVSNDYDNLDRIKAKKHNNTIRYRYEYDASGNVGYHEDLVNGVNYRYIYDTAERLVSVTDSAGNVLNYEYDKNNNASKVKDKVNATTYETSYGYDKDNKLTSIVYTRAAATSISLAYDVLGRLQTRKVSIGGVTTPQFETSYSYLAGANGSKTNKVSSINNDGSTISYTYNKNGNIETITQNINGTNFEIKYTYNELNELRREDNNVLNKTITYSYDAGGNIKSKVEYGYTTGTLGIPTATVNYTYGDTNWKDKLTSFHGRNITYDAIGNPLTYSGNTYTWEEGRQLKSIVGTSGNISYKYNDSGIRTEKNVGGVVSKYHLVGDKVTFETNGADKIYYTYDSRDNLVSMSLNGVEYYYIRNAQGDIIGLFDKAGTQVVSYVYDSWGKLISNTGTLATTVGVKNPYRYRGYRYDTETGLYYLQSRYFNPDWGRFINVDGIAGQTGELLSHNMFAYCMNNPVNMQDKSGYMARPLNDTIGAGGPIIDVSGGLIAAIYLTAKMIGDTGTSAQRISKASSDEMPRGEYTVYALSDPETGDVKYVGRTIDYNKRMKAHQKPGSKTAGLEPTVRIDNLNRIQARGLEQLGMLYFNTHKSKGGKNDYWGISSNNPRGVTYLLAGLDIGNYLYNQISNEVLCWVGQ
jgi:RHS repeat-associated protein